MRILALLFFLLSFTATAQVKQTFKTLKFDSVVMYDFEGSKGRGLHIVEGGRLAATIVKQVELDGPAVKTLSKKLTDKKSYGGATASCFDPHLGFVYFLKGTIVGYVTICLDCNCLYANIDIPEQRRGKVGKGSEAYYLADGLSTSFRKHLNELLKKHGFSHQLQNGAVFNLN
jgi:hypothetical protein